MGVVRPPWISKEWFSKCPFNYCDHFGNQEKLALVCKICKDELKRKSLYEKAGEDPYELEYVLKDLTETFEKVGHMIAEDAKRLGIDLNNLPEYQDLAPEPETYPIFTLIRNYSDHIKKTLENLQAIPAHADIHLIHTAIDVLSHSQSYIVVKTARALHSQYEEKEDPSMEELADSKTSAFFAFMAIERNSRALLALAKHEPLHQAQEQYLKLAAVSLQLAESIRETFFSDDKLSYEEFGCEEYDECFNNNRRKQAKEPSS